MFSKNGISIQTSLSNLGFRHRYHAFHPFDTAKLRHKKNHNQRKTLIVIYIVMFAMCFAMTYYES